MRGFEGEEIGTIEDILVNDEGLVSALVVKGGGFLGFGDAVFTVPWDLVALTPGEPDIVVPITKETAEQRGLFDGPDRITIEPGVRLVSTLLDNPVRLGADTEFGVLLDLVFDAEGRVMAAVVSRSSGVVQAVPEDAGPPRWSIPIPTGRTIVVIPADAVTIRGGALVGPQ